MLAAIKALSDEGHEVIVGTATDGYLVVAQHPTTGAKMSVRPLVEMTSKGVTLMLRTRIAPVGESETVKKEGVETTKYFAAHADWAESYPTIDWSRTDSFRRVVEITAVSPRPAKTAWAALADFVQADTFSAMAAFLYDQVPAAHRRISKAVLTQTLQLAFNELLSDYTPHEQNPGAIQKNINHVKAQIEAYTAKLAEYEKTLASVDNTVAELQADLPQVKASGVAYYRDAIADLPSLPLSQTDESDEDEDEED